MNQHLDLPDPAAPCCPPSPRPREMEILQTIRRTFAEKGFDGASMQDLARAAGMSVGNFYRYFPSKAAMVSAMIRVDLAEVEGKFALIAAAPHPLEALRAALHERIREEAPGCEDAPLWAEITAAALRKPEIAAVVARMETEIAGYLSRAMAQSAGLSEAEGARRFGALARMLVLLVKGNAMQAQVRGAEWPELTELLLRIVDDLLDDITRPLPESRPLAETRPLPETHPSTEALPSPLAPSPAQPSANVQTQKDQTDGIR